MLEDWELIFLFSVEYIENRKLFYEEVIKEYAAKK